VAPVSVSAAHVSATLAKAGHPRATEPYQSDSGCGDSGFFVQIENASWADGGQVVTVGQQVYEYEGDYSDRVAEIVGRIVEEALDRYTGTLLQHGYVVEDWMRYDGVRLGLFVTGREA
jgi:hypothetical protein